LLAEIAAARRGLDPGRFALIQKKLVGQLCTSFQSIDQLVTGQIDCCVKSEQADLLDALAAYDNLTLDDVQRRLAGYFTPEQSVLSVIKPK